MTLTGVLATHYHPDHVGGDMMGFSISGITDLLNLASVPIHVQNEEAELVDKVTGVGFDNLRTHSSGDKISVGSIEIELIHTPGHTPGSQCFLVENRLSQDKHFRWPQHDLPVRPATNVCKFGQHR